MIDCAILIYIKSQLNENDEEASRSRSDHAIFEAESSLIQGKKKIGIAWDDGILIVIIDHYLEQLRLVFAIKCVPENIRPVFDVR